MENNSNDNPVQQAFDSWASTIRSGTEKKIAQSMLFSVFNASGVSARFSAWLLAITGATIGLAFSNLESINSAISTAFLRAAFILLIISCASGFIARVFASYVELYRELISEIERNLTRVMEDHEAQATELKDTAGEAVEPPNLDPDVDRAVALAISCMPPIVKWWIERKVDRGKNDPFSIYRKATNFVLLQSVATFIQILSFGAFAVVVLCSV